LLFPAKLIAAMPASVPCLEASVGLYEGEIIARAALATANPGRWTKPALDGVPDDGNVII
jgi:hypothetical protein